ncbi:MAG TPA: hypothetical protein V6D33_12680 [Cyanophyceae cyanobacterium]
MNKTISKNLIPNTTLELFSATGQFGVKGVAVGSGILSVWIQSEVNSRVRLLSLKIINGEFDFSDLFKGFPLLQGDRIIAKSDSPITINLVVSDDASVSRQNNVAYNVEISSVQASTGRSYPSSSKDVPVRDVVAGSEKNVVVNAIASGISSGESATESSVQVSSNEA